MKHALPTPHRRRNGRRVLVTTGLLALAAAGVGGAAFAAFTGTTAASQSVQSGTLTLSGIGTNTAGNRLTVAATGLAPGDSVQRAVTVTNAGTLDLSGISLTTSASTSSLLDTDTATGLQMAIDRCSVAWTESAFPYTYTCAGAATTVLASTPVIGTNRPLANLALTAGATNNLRVTVTLPSAAGNALQGQSSVIGYTFAASQRAATSK